METLDRILGEHPFFEGMSQDQLEFLAECATTKIFKTGEVIFREGGEANHFYLICQGKIALEIFNLEHGPIIIQTIGPGDILGWSWLVPPYQWRFDARAVEITDAIALDGRCLRAKCEEGHDLGYELLKRFALVIEQRLQATRSQLLDVYGTRR